MGRPRLPDLERRECSTRADLTVAEKAGLARKAQLAGLSEAEFIRALIRESRVVVREAPGHSDPALITEINQIAMQLRHAGVTANKLAMATHTKKRFRGRWQEVAEGLDEARALAADVLGRVV